MIRPTLTATRLLQRRTFSILPRIRSIAKNAEINVHPFQGYPKTQKSAPTDFKVLARHLAGPALFYFPAFGLFIGWPLMAEKVLDGHV